MPKITQQHGGKQPTKSKAGAWEDVSGLDPWIKMCLYGKSGTGKTTLCGTFPKPIGIMIASGAGETKSVRNVQGIKAVRLSTESELLDRINEQRETNQFKTLVLDHASGYQDLVLKKVLGREDIPSQLGWGVATQKEWGELALRMKDNLRELLSLDCNIVIICQEREFNTDGENNGILAPYVNSALTPSVSGWLGPQVDYLCQTFLRMQTEMREATIQGQKIKKEVETGKVEFCLRTAPHPVFATKFRVPRGVPLPSVVTDPSYEKIKKLIDRQPQ